MKNKLIASAIALFGFTAIAMAQPPVGVSATAITTATIVTPISIANTITMKFGNVAVTSSGGTVVLDLANGRSTTGGVTLPNVTGLVTTASFAVAGTAGYTFAITLPSTALILTGVPGGTMSVDAFTTTAATGTLTAGAATVLVGATLHVATAQPAGLYTNEPGFVVTVNYN